MTRSKGAQMRRWDEEGGMEVLVGDTFVSRPMSGGYKHPDSDRPPPFPFPHPFLGAVNGVKSLYRDRCLMPSKNRMPVVAYSVQP